MQTPKFTINLCRAFSVGLTIHSPKFNGLSVELALACFAFRFWNRGGLLFGFRNYWNT